MEPLEPASGNRPEARRPLLMDPAGTRPSGFAPPSVLSSGHPAVGRRRDARGFDAGDRHRRRPPPRCWPEPRAWAAAVPGEASFGPVSQVVRVSIRTLSSRIDLVLPDRTTIAETLETVLELAPRSLREQAIAHGGWILRTAAGEAIPGSSTLLDQGSRRRRHPLPDRHRRIGQRCRLRRRRRCGRRHRRHRSVRLAGWWWPKRSRSAQPDCSPRSAACHCCGRVRRGPRSRSLSDRLPCSPWSPPVCCPGGSVTPGSRRWPGCSRSWPAPPQPRSRRPAPCALIGDRRPAAVARARPPPLSSRRLRPWSSAPVRVPFAAIITGSLLLCIALGCCVIFDLPRGRGAAIVVGLAVALMPVVPNASLRLARFELEPLPTTADEVYADHETVDTPAVRSRTRQAVGYVTALIQGLTWPALAGVHRAGVQPRTSPRRSWPASSASG